MLLLLGLDVSGLDINGQAKKANGTQGESTSTSGTQAQVGAGEGANPTESGSSDSSNHTDTSEMNSTELEANNSQTSDTEDANVATELSGDPMAEEDDLEIKRKVATFQMPTARTGTLPWSGEAAGSKSDFFGAEAAGKQFVYIVDASGSMTGSAFTSACSELIRSIEELKSSQSYFVIFFNDVSHEAPRRAGKPFWPANKKNKTAIKNWIQQALPGGGTQPLDALLTAIDLRPDAVFFLTDGEFGSSIVDAVCDANTHQVPIHTIAFGSGAANSLLEELASRTGGTSRLVGP